MSNARIKRTLIPFNLAPITAAVFAVGAVVSLAACDPTVPIIPKDPDRCDVGVDVYCQPDVKPKSGPDELGG